MKNKTQNLYVCSKCDAQFLKWSGKCLECGAWGTLESTIIDKEEKTEINVAPAQITNLSKIDAKQNNFNRIKTNILEIDQVLGGGLVQGSLSLISGEPGIGKSTMLAQIANAIGMNPTNEVIYVSGEESGAQVKNRFERLHCEIKNIDFISETNADKIIAACLEKNSSQVLGAKNKSTLVIVDSIQTIYSSLLPNESGSVNQIRACTAKFLELAKENNITVILVGHVTKDGQIAGPKLLEHIVDTVLYLESDPSNNYQMLRAKKNRFGSINELGIFQMTSTGFREVANPSSVFINDQKQKISGSVTSCIIEGSRPFFVEVQALVTKTVFGYPQRKSSGFDLNRLQVLTSVISKKTKINLANQDVIINVVGGFRVSDPSLDLAICLAIISSAQNKIINKQTIVLGEIGLGGEVRNIAKLKEKINEARKLGFDRAIIPQNKIKIREFEIINILNLNDAFQVIL